MLRMVRPGFVIAAMAVTAGAAWAQSPFATQDPLAQALQQSSVFVGKTLRSQVDTNALQALTQNAPSDRPLKIVVVNNLPATGQQYGTRGKYTKALHDYLNLGRGALIVVTQRGLSIATDALPDSQITAIEKQNVAAIQNNPVAGITGVVQSLDAAASGQKNGNAPVGRDAGSGNAPAPPMDDNRGQTQGGGFPWVPAVLGVGGVGAAAWFGSRALNKQKAMETARVPVERLRGEVVNGISYADTYLDLLPSSAQATAARQERQQAAGLLEQASGLARSAKTPEDYGRAEALLEQAKAQSDRCRSDIDVATGGTGFAVAVEGTDYKATPKTPDGRITSQAAPILSGINIEDIPANERGACFFCSRPARLSDLTPISIAVNGQRRKVLACADDVRIIQNGSAPEVRTVEVEGRPMPWYSARSYDPYRDYGYAGYGYMPGYGGYGYGPGMLDGFLLGSLLSQPYYAMPYPVFATPMGEPTMDYRASDPGNYNDGGGYIGDGGGNFDSGNAGDNSGVASTDFFGTGGSDFASSNDNSSSDSGGFGSVDTSSFDSGSGGSDFGGSDFGGGDSGGGGDFGGGDSGGGGDY